MRLSFAQLSLTSVVALTVILSSSSFTAINALPSPIHRHQPTTSSFPAVKYDNHRVVRIQIDTKDQLDVLTAHERQLRLDYFSHHKVLGGHIDVRIAPEHFKEFQDLHLDYKVQIEDLQTVLDKEAEENAVFQQKWEVSKKTNKSIDGQELTDVHEQGANVFASTANWFAGYHTYADHQTWLATQIKTYPTITKSFSAGNTYQGRSQAGIMIGSGSNNVVLHGLQHSREW